MNPKKTKKQDRRKLSDSSAVYLRYIHEKLSCIQEEDKLRKIATVIKNI